MEERGVVRTAEGQLRRIRIEAEDDCGNRSALEFTVRGRSESFRAEADTAAVALYPDRTSLVQVGREARTSIPEGALYEPIFVKPERREAPQADSGVVVLSPAYRFLSPDTPLRHPAAVTVRTRVPRRLQFRTALAVRNRKGRLAWVGGSYANGAVTASTYATATWSRWPTRSHPRSGPSSPRAPTSRNPKACVSAPPTISRASPRGRCASTANGSPATGSP